MKKLATILLLLTLSLISPLYATARDRAVTPLGKTAIISEGLFFKICDISTSKNTVTVTVQAKNKSLMSQAVYLELADETGSLYAPQNKDSIDFFGPLKFNLTVTQKISFTVPNEAKNYYLAVYSKDLFKKNKKELITKMTLKEAVKEINFKQ